MKTMQFTTYKKGSKFKDKDRKRQSKIDIDINICEIMALTTARGEGKWPRLYVADYSEPLELPEQSFDEIKDKLIEASLSEYNNINKFIPVGTKMLVNYDTVFRIRKQSGEIVFYDNQILDDLDAEMLAEYEKQSAIEKDKPRKLNFESSILFLESLAKWQREETYKHANKFTRIFGTLDDKMAANEILFMINIVVSIVLIIMIGILLHKL